MIIIILRPVSICLGVQNVAVKLLESGGSLIMNLLENGPNPPLFVHFSAVVTGRCTTMYWRFGLTLGIREAIPLIRRGLAYMSVGMARETRSILGSRSYTVASSEVLSAKMHETMALDPQCRGPKVQAVHILTSTGNNCYSFWSTEITSTTLSADQWRPTSRKLGCCGNISLTWIELIHLSQRTTHSRADMTTCDN